MSLYIKEIGKVGSPTTVLLLHGFCENHTIWDNMLPAFDGAEICLVDLPGFGRSQTELPSPLTIDWVADRIFDEVVKPMNKKPFIVGHSLGGYVALSLAERYVHATSGLCLFHSTAYPDSDEKKQTRNKVMDFVNEKGVDEYISQFVPGLFHSTFRRAHAGAVQEVVDLAAKTPKETILAYLQAMRDRPDRKHVLKEYSGKKMIVAGEKDGAVPLEQSLAMKDVVGEAQFRLLKDTAHMGMFEKMEESRQALRAFLKA